MAKPRSKFKKVKWLFGKEIEIPEEWDTIFISAEFKLKTGGTPSRTQPRYFDGDIHWVTSTDLNRSSITSTLESISWDAKEITRLEIFQKGTFVIATYGLEAAGTRGKCGILNVNATINQACLAFIPTGKITTKFLFYFYLKYGEQIAFNYAQGTKQQNLYPGIVGKISITKPPIPEQQKIASILSGVDALIESTQRTIEKTERLKKGLMQKLLTKGIEHTKFKKINGLFRKEIKIPEEWSRCQLKDTSMLGAGGTPSTFAKEFWNNGTIPWISSSEVKNNRIIDSDKKITKLGLENSAAKLFPKGTVLVAITGFGMTRGRSAILEINASTNQSVVGIQSKREILDGEFLWYLLQNQYWVIRNFAQGSQQPGLNLDILEKFQICVPNNISEQQKIASILSGVDAYIQKNQEYKKKMELLKKGLMQKLLTGQIRVKVDH